MRELVIGSTSMAFYWPDEVRDPNDLDVFSPDRVYCKDNFWDDRLSVWIPDGTSRLATPDELLTIKLSHVGWDLKNDSWQKHMEDIVFLQDKGAHVSEWLYNLLVQVWTDKHGKKRVDLNMDKTAFFDDGVKRKYDHDSLHESVAFGDRPLWESVLKDGQQVAMDMSKVWALPFEQQINLFLEEVYVTALERKVIPSDYECSRRGAYNWALRRTVTSLTKGKSSRFIAENYRYFKPAYKGYVERHLSKAHLLKEL
jgi:hypothetical protein